MSTASTGCRSTLPSVAPLPSPTIEDRARVPVQQERQVAEEVLHVALARRLRVAADVQAQEVALPLHRDDRRRALAIVDHLVVIGAQHLLHLRAREALLAGLHEPLRVDVGAARDEPAIPRRHERDRQRHRGREPAEPEQRPPSRAARQAGARSAAATPALSSADATIVPRIPSSGTRTKPATKLPTMLPHVFAA